MNDLIISLAFLGRENYPEIQKGLIASIEKHWKGDAWINPDIPYTPHSEMPYQFKYDLIEEAVRRNYKKIWWLDSTMRLNRDITGLLNNSESGIVAFDNIGHPVFKYISDEAADNLMVDDIYLKRMRQCWGGCTGWDFSNKGCEWIFKKVKEQIRLGSFKEGISKRKEFLAHRHDQAVLSVIFHFYNVSLLPYGIIAAPKDVTDKTYIIYGDK